MFRKFKKLWTSRKRRHTKLYTIFYDNLTNAEPIPTITISMSSTYCKQIDRLPSVFVKDCGYIPVVLTNAAAIIEKNLRTKELFQTQGQASKINQSMNLLKTTSKSKLKTANVHDVIEAIKVFLVRLPEPLLPDDVCDALISASKSDSSTDRYKEILDGFRQTSPHCFAIAHFMMRLMQKVASQSQHNLMDVRKLATIFVLDVIKPLKLEDSDNGAFLNERMQRLPYLIMVVENLINDVDIFKSVSQLRPRSVNNTPSSKSLTKQRSTASLKASRSTTVATSIAIPTSMESARIEKHQGDSTTAVPDIDKVVEETAQHVSRSSVGRNTPQSARTLSLPPVASQARAPTPKEAMQQSPRVIPHYGRMPRADVAVQSAGDDDKALENGAKPGLKDDSTTDHKETSTQTTSGKKQFKKTSPRSKKRIRKDSMSAGRCSKNASPLPKYVSPIKPKASSPKLKSTSSTLKSTSSTLKSTSPISKTSSPKRKVVVRKCSFVDRTKSSDANVTKAPLKRQPSGQKGRQNQDHSSKLKKKTKPVGKKAKVETSSKLIKESNQDLFAFHPDEEITPWTNEASHSDDTSLLNNTIKNPRILPMTTPQAKSTKTKPESAESPFRTISRQEKLKQKKSEIIEDTSSADSTLGWNAKKLLSQLSQAEKQKMLQYDFADGVGRASHLQNSTAINTSADNMSPEENMSDGDSSRASSRSRKSNKSLQASPKYKSDTSRPLSVIQEGPGTSLDNTSSTLPNSGSCYPDRCQPLEMQQSCERDRVTETALASHQRIKVTVRGRRQLTMEQYRQNLLNQAQQQRQQPLNSTMCEWIVDIMLVAVTLFCTCFVFYIHQYSNDQEGWLQPFG